MSEIFFNNKGSYTDFGAILTHFIVQPPIPKIIKEDVPYMNGSYDFSDLYGETAYKERKISCRLFFTGLNKNLLYIKYSQFLEWLLGSGKARLEHTDEPGLYYMAKVENAPSWDTFAIAGTLDIEFIADPFKYYKNNEGTDIWDDFNFETDIAQSTKFDVAGGKTIKIYNLSSRKITPTIICSAPINVVKGSTIYKFNSGTTKDWRFSLDKGINSLALNGNGNIEFVFRKEVL